MLQPKKQKYRKQIRGRMKGNASCGNRIDFGDFGVQTLDCAWVTAKQIEAGRRAIANYTNRKGKYWVRIFPDKPVTKKPAEVRMGSGKSAVNEFVCVVKPGRILFEVGGVEPEVAIEALRRAAQKMSVRTRIVNKDSIFG